MWSFYSCDQLDISLTLLRWELSVYPCKRSHAREVTISLRFACDWFMRDSSESIIDGAKQSHSDPKSVSTLQLKMEMCFEFNKCFSWKFLRADECYDYCFRSMCTIWTWTSMNLSANNQVGLIPGGELRRFNLLCGQTRKHCCEPPWTQVKGDKWSLKA